MVAAVIYVKPKLPIINGYAAKKTCSCTFISNRTLESIKQSDLQIFPTNYTKHEIDKTKKSVSSSLLGFGKRTAVYTKGLGCTLLPDEVEINDLDKQEIKLTKSVDSFYPKQLKISNNKKLKDAINFAFDLNGEKKQNTRAVVVLKDGKLIAEKYADGFDLNTPILGWSMTKSLTSALIGILVKQGKLNIEQQNLFPIWEKDKRATISINDLLQMGSGLNWDETYSQISDATKMLYMKDDFPQYAIDKPYLHKPGTHWEYSSGTTNIISKIAEQTFDNKTAYYQFIYNDLLNKIGMNSAEIETDIYGSFVGSSYCYASPRDWARFGQLYLNDGIWNGERILPEGWVKYSYTNFDPSKGEYGAQWWLNKSNKLPDVDDNVYWCSGFQGQKVYVIPNENMVVVRMGISERGTFDFNKFLSGIIAAVK